MILAIARVSLVAFGNVPVIALTADGAIVDPAAMRIHEPMLIGEVTLNIRILFRNRAGRPRSEMSRTGDRLPAASATITARRPSSALPRRSARHPRVDAAPAMPPTKK